MTISGEPSDPTTPRHGIQPIYVAIDESFGMRRYTDAINTWLPEFHGVLQQGAFSASMSIIAFSDEAELIMPMSPASDIHDMPGTVSAASSGANFGSLFSAVRRAVADDASAFAARGVEAEAPIVLLLSLAIPSDGHRFFRAHADLVEAPRPVRPLIVGVGFRHTNRRLLKLISHKVLDFEELLDVFTGYRRVHNEKSRMTSLHDHLQSRPDWPRDSKKRSEDASPERTSDTTAPAVGPSASRPATPSPCFVSHASSEQSQAAQFASELESHGISTWMASRDVPPGSDYAAQIVDAIESASAFIILLSPESTSSEHCLRELNLAVEMKKRIIPVWLQEHELSRGFRYRLSTIQIVNRSKIGDVMPSLRSGD